jgi:lactate dehydrogenase-like 2-hydroxyacid dehydrogenase
LADAKPPILVIPRTLGALADILERDYTVHRFWEGPPADVAPTIRAMVVLGGTPLEPSLVDSLPNLGLVAYFSAGYETFDAKWARERGVLGTHSQWVNADDTADMAIGLIYALVRNIVEGDRQVRAGQWRKSVKIMSRSLGGMKVGVVGLGSIGQAVAVRCEAMKMVPAWWGPREKPDAKWPRAASLLELAQESDILVVTAKADENNRGLISKEVIEALGPDGLLINIARGQLVDQAALIAALKDGRLGGAGLDVYEVEPTPPEDWADVPNTVLAPHIGGATHEAVHAMTVQLMENLAAFHAGKPLPNPIREP